jgi:hypothetical protein
MLLTKVLHAGRYPPASNAGQLSPDTFIAVQVRKFLQQTGKRE